MTVRWPCLEWRSARLGLWSSVACFLFGCSTVVPQVEQTSLEAATYFSLTGRLSVRDGQQVEIAGISWRRTSAEESISLRSPLGSEVARVWREQNGLARLRAGEDERTGPDIETLAGEVLRAAVPLRALAWWIQGRDAEGRMLERAQFDHEGWQVSIEDFPQSSDLPVARRITARKGELSLRLVIDNWMAER